MAHPLRVYLDRHGITEADFSKAVHRLGGGTSPNHISQIIGGHRKPGGRMACAISDATNGNVSVDDLLRFERPRATKKRKRAA